MNMEIVMGMGLASDRQVTAIQDYTKTKTKKYDMTRNVKWEESHLVSRRNCELKKVRPATAPLSTTNVSNRKRPKRLGR